MQPQTSASPVMPGKPIIGKVTRKLITPETDGASCIYFPSHAAERLEERFGLKSFSTPPFTVNTYYCEADDVDRPVWAIPLPKGYVLGRWEESLRTDVPYRQWFIATTCIQDWQWRRSHLFVVNTINVNIVRIIDQRNFLTNKKI
jgi:hypothetical protein